MGYNQNTVKIIGNQEAFMLTFEEKLAIITSFPALERKDVSLGRVNFHYNDSILDKKIVVYHLHPNGNGYVYAEHIPHTSTDDKGFVNIRDFATDELRALIQASIASLSGNGASTAVDAVIPELEAEGILEERWTDAEGQLLVLLLEDDLWNVYTGANLEMAFETYKEAKQYLQEEGFSLS
jgi:hypothetical protein